MKKPRPYLFTVVGLALAVFAGMAQAATCTSQSSGNWNTTARWKCPSTVRLPADGDSVVIANGHTVTLDVDTPNLNDLTITGTLDSNAGKTITVAGNATVSGTLKATQSGMALDVTVGGNLGLSAGGKISSNTSGTVSVGGNMTTNATSAVDLGNGSVSISIAANLINSSAIGSCGTDTGGFNFYNGTGTLTIGGSLNNNSGACLRIGDNIPSGVSGLKVIGSTDNTGQIYANTSGAVLEFVGDLRNRSAGRITSTWGTSVVLRGDYRNDNNSFVPSNNWIFRGSVAQRITNNATTFNFIEIDNAAGVTLTGGNLTVGVDTNNWTQRLTLTNGKLSTGAYKVILSKSCDSNTLTRTNGWVNGFLTYNTMPTWNYNCVFHVGDANNYAPVTIYPNWQPPSSGTLTVSTSAGDHPDITSALTDIDATQSVNRYWTLTGSGLDYSTNKYQATFQYCNGASGTDCAVNDVDTGVDGSKLIVAEKVGSTWSQPFFDLPASNTLHATALSNFGIFSIGQAVPDTCLPPSNLPVGVSVSCVCDNFKRATLNPSTIFGSNWLATASDGLGILPRIANSGYLRLTENTTNNAKAVTVPGIFPAAGNYISVEFKHYAYAGNGADGIAVTLSDYSVPAQPGAYGGSLGYAQRSGVVGFAGGWIGVAIDEFGNFQDPGEGRNGGPGRILDSVSVRGSGSGSVGYKWLKGTGVLSPGIDNTGSTTAAPGYLYQVIVDARANVGSSAAADVTVNRNSGSGYSAIIGPFDVQAAALAQSTTQAVVPANWQISFTGSTGGNTNYHEIGALKICAQSVTPTTGGILGGFNAIDSAIPSGMVNALQGHIYTKLAGTPFKLNIAALNATSSDIEKTYAFAANKNVTVELFDDSVGASCNTSSSACSTCSKPVVATQSMTFLKANAGFKTSGDFTVDNAYSRLIARVKDATGSPTVYGCSTDAFAVRPSALVVSKTVTALNAGVPFTLQATAVKADLTSTATNYLGTPALNTGNFTGTPGFTAGALIGTLPAATAGVSTGTFTYDEVGSFTLPAATGTYGISDSTYAAIDVTGGDCVVGSATNTIDSSGKYGCLIGQSAALTVGAFIPDHFELSSSSFAPGCGSFTYMQQPFKLGYTVTAKSQARVAPTVNPPGNTALKLYTGGKLNIAAINGSTELTTRLTPANPLTPVWTNGAYTQAATDYTIARPVTTTPDATWGMFDLLNIGLGIDDPDGISYALGVVTFTATTPAACQSGSACKKYASLTGGATAKLRFGRLWLGNVYGSEQSALSLPYETQYWNGWAFVKNALDSCTVLTNANIGLGNYQNAVTDSNLPLASVSPGAFASGAGTIRLAAPSAAGSVDVVVRLNPSGSLGMCPAWTPTFPTVGTATQLDYLRSKWCGTSYDKDPVARATFGIYRNNRQIFLREGF